MPWKELSVREEKLRFVAECLDRVETMTELCERYGISRETGYRLHRRYLEHGPCGLEDLSRAPHCHGRKTAEEIAAAIIALRQQRPHWGAKKLLALLARRRPEVGWPAPSTATGILRRAGLIAPRGRRRRRMPVEQPFQEVAQPNDTWCIDFKGWFRTQDGSRCDPLTVTDAHSRYLLACRIIPPQTAPVQAAVDELFREHGMPLAIRSDNGPPFASVGVAGLSRLAVHWLKLGIRLERIAPAQPQQNGRHERMHRTLKADTSRPPAASLAEQQRRFDAFQHEFNHHRPHEALQQQMPAEHFEPSSRRPPDKVLEPWYDADHQVRRVRPTGEIKWNGELVFISEALAGEPVGIVETESGAGLVRFAGVDLGIIARKTGKLHGFAAARPKSRRQQTNGAARDGDVATVRQACPGGSTGQGACAMDTLRQACGLPGQAPTSSALTRAQQEGSPQLKPGTL